MIRFCDMEVNCIEYCSLSDKDTLNRADIRLFFLGGHQDDIICVYDDFNNMEFMGIITYQTLNQSLTFRGAIQTEYLIMDKDIWENGRKCFQNMDMRSLIPVLDTDYRLLCFAYEDMEANREIRMIRELVENPDALQFTDVYPEYHGVKIYGFNELAYYFAEYIKQLGIAVEVVGAMWRNYFTEQDQIEPEYERFMLYAEGIEEKKQSWKEKLLRSASVEFECVDKIYEVNIKHGLIKDAKGDWEALLERLQGGENIVLCGVGRAEQDAYDFFVGNGIDVCCFMDILCIERKHKLFGKEILSEKEARHIYKNPIFIDCVTRNSAWGFGRVDYYDYIGYRRNERFILLKDYIQVESNNLINVLKNTNTVLLGDAYLCHQLSEYLKSKNVLVVGYLDITPNDFDQQDMKEIYTKDIDENDMCLVIAPAYFTYKGFHWDKTGSQGLLTFLSENNINNYSEYFSDMDSFIFIDDEKRVKYTKEWLMPKRIALGSIDGCSGCEFFRGLLNDHPYILIMDNCDFETNLFWICIRHSMETSEIIFSKFLEIINDDNKMIFNVCLFKEKLEQLLARDDKFTSQELFVLVHIAYAYACGRNVEKINIKDMIIYWEPHMVDRENLEKCVNWLGTEKVPCDIINIVRNVCTQNGSSVKLVKNQGMQGAFFKSLIKSLYSWDKKKQYYGKRLIVKFEDLKCTPEKTLQKICDSWGMPWSDTLMATTFHGEEWAWNNGVREVKDFDLEPVYNTYENFYSEFDRLRMMIIHAPWQREYGYPYVGLLQFTKRELQEMFLKSFHFENLGDTELYRDSLNYRIWLQTQIREKLQVARMIETML